MHADDESLVDALEKVLPDLHIIMDRSGLRLTTDDGVGGAVGAEEIRPLSSVRERRELQAAGRNFVDLRGGVIHVRGAGFYVHARFPVSRSRLTGLECGLLAVLCEIEPGVAGALLTGPGDKLQRRLESITGETVRDMTITRLKAALSKNGVVIEDAANPRLDREGALTALRRSFRLRAIGPTGVHAMEDVGRVRELVEDLRPACIEGVSRVARDAGAHLAGRDLIGSREAAVSIRDRLGPQVGPDYDGPTVTVRTATRVSVAILAGRIGRDHLNPLLAAAGLGNEPGHLGEIGRDVWETLARSM